VSAVKSKLYSNGTFSSIGVIISRRAERASEADFQASTQAPHPVPHNSIEIQHRTFAPCAREILLPSAIVTLPSPNTQTEVCNLRAHLSITITFNKQTNSPTPQSRSPNPLQKTTANMSTYDAKKVQQGEMAKIHKIRITLTSRKVSSLEKVCQELIDRSKSKDLRVKGPVRMPTKNLKISTRKTPCGEGSKTWDTYEMR
jgi:small subunit ribosomal protein S20e